MTTFATVTADKAAVYAEVDIITAYIGAKTDRYDTIPTIDADSDLIDIFWRDARAWATASLGAAIASAESTDRRLTVTMAVTQPGGEQAIDPSLTLEPLMRSALARHIIWQWLSICAPAEAEPHLAEARSALDGLKRLSTASRPTTRRIPPM